MRFQNFWKKVFHLVIGLLLVVVGDDYSCDFCVGGVMMFFVVVSGGDGSDNDVVGWWWVIKISGFLGPIRCKFWRTGNLFLLSENFSGEGVWVSLVKLLSPFNRWEEIKKKTPAENQTKLHDGSYTRPI